MTRGGFCIARRTQNHRLTRTRSSAGRDLHSSRGGRRTVFPASLSNMGPERGKLDVNGATNVARGPRCIGRRDGISGNSFRSSLLCYGAVISQPVRWRHDRNRRRRQTAATVGVAARGANLGSPHRRCGPDPTDGGVRRLAQQFVRRRLAQQFVGRRLAIRAGAGVRRVCP
jgi:hypothetical protein